MATRDEMMDARMWFLNVYTYKEQKYRRLIVLGVSDEGDIKSPEERLRELYLEAEEKRKIIQDYQENNEKPQS